MKGELVSKHKFTSDETQDDMGGNTGSKDLKGKEGWKSIKKDMKSGSKESKHCKSCTCSGK